MERAVLMIILPRPWAVISWCTTDIAVWVSKCIRKVVYRDTVYNVIQLILY